ncbi:MAG: glycosyltransferase 87 family protein [Acidimicrobiales bacterium]
MSTPRPRLSALRALRDRALHRLGSVGPEAGDAILYAASAAFAALTILTSGLALYRQWAELAIGPFLFGAVCSAVLAIAAARRSRRVRGNEAEAVAVRDGTRRHWSGRVAVAVCVFAGATAIPLGLEIVWRSDGDPGSHVQPEVTNIERAGRAVVKGNDPYPYVTNPHGKVVHHLPGVSPVNSFVPYLPLMTVFGMPSEKKHDIVLTDARIFFSLATLLVAGAALFLCPADGRRKMRALQVIAILPTAALPLATGGDDMPVVAFLLLAMVLAQRRQPFASGIVLGIVSAMKFTAWPLAALALFAARDRKGERRPLLMVLGMLVVAGPVVVPFALRGPWAFFDNVVLFPLGLSGVNSPAASPLPGHLLVSTFPFLHRVLPLAVGLVGGSLLAWYLIRRPPRSVAQVCMVGGVVMAVITLLAPATRIGYLLYPINFLTWSYLFAGPWSGERPGDGEGIAGTELELSLSAPL